MIPGPMVADTVTLLRYCPLAAAGFAFDHRFHEALKFVFQLFCTERSFAYRRVDDVGLVKSVLNFTGFDLFESLWTSMVTVPDLGFGMSPLGPRSLPSRPTTPIISGVATTTSKVKPVLCLDLLSHFFGSYIIGSSCFGLLSLRSLGKNQYFLGLTCSVRKYDGALLPAGLRVFRQRPA